MAQENGRIGFNISKNNELMAEIARQYETIASKITENWPAINDVLDREWIGEDQIAFKQALGQRINKLYSSTNDLAVCCVNTLGGLVKSWLDWQQENAKSLKDKETGVSLVEVKEYTDTTEIPRISSIIPITVIDFEITSDMDRGLASGSSFSTIQTAIEEYVTNIKSAIKNLFESIDAGTAFYGSQSNAINNYIEKVEYAITEVVVAIKDMYENIATMAGSAYTTASQDLSADVDSGATTLEEKINAESSSRWT